MKITILTVGKKNDPLLDGAINQYLERVQNYTQVDWEQIDSSGSSDPEKAKLEEGEVILRKINKHDTVVLLDERGVDLSTVELTELMRGWQNQSVKHVAFIIGGAFGVSQDVRNRAALEWRLSKLVFPHQISRLLLIEQLYRAYTILHNHPYHHQ